MPPALTETPGHAGHHVRRPDIWIVVPAYNEEERLARTLTSLERAEGNVVVVDDGSSDGTADVARQFPVRVLQHCINCGQGASLQTGIDFALRQGADVIVTFDADGQHSADEIAHLTEPVVHGDVDVALGSRFLGNSENLPTSRWAILKLGILFTRLVSQVRVTDTHNGLRAFSRKAAERIRITQNRMAHASEILEEIRHHGLRYVEVPVTIRYTAETLAKGQSSWNAVCISGQMLLGKMMR
ncbi:Undecaprenyl-phosphate mannosyltransferase [Maioricimonas rarisocia]|uniref:Undecaprenyl-phosphate mannosyltransferase n=1 Tax=Maioricimonas rarisocia TaxID=2528026 RepID=A0A517Z1A6_9PLAN|nr:glycosyltransferase family 2 protein [Maioricimonas rarisocia]QDU36254.1 Undecaprenyl-phosphate mannosyltransferase [Maioricimonas rarisocia]